MKKVINKLKIIKNCIEGLYIKIVYRFFDMNKLIENDNNIIVSLTSYGRRISSALPCTLKSLLRQDLLPSKIIVWLDDNNSLETLPKKLRKFQRYGVSFRFCSDIRSYKKLVPTLSVYKNNVIITVDDDVYYSKKLISSLFSSYIKEPNRIHCTVAHAPKFKDNKLLSYSLWHHNISKNTKCIFPVGVGGVLYPPNSLNNEVLKSEIFMKLCPRADDIWFWIMALKNNTQHRFVYMKCPFYNVDGFYQYFHPNSNLAENNVSNLGNDIQFKNILNYYKINFNIYER